LTAKLAAALRELFKIPYEHAESMSAEQIISLVQWQHIFPHALDGSDEHWNIEPLLIQQHREVTAKIDIPQIAKTKRISREHEEFQRRLLTPRDEREPRKSRWPSRKFPKRVKP
jgi:hypothetical protein